MKIGIDISQSVYMGTGVASYTQNLVKALLAQGTDEYVLFGSSLRRQEELHTFTGNLPTASTVTVRTSLLPPSLLSLLWNQWHLFSIEKFVGQVDLFHTSDWTEPPSKCPKITTIHDLIIYRYPQHLPESIIRNHTARLEWVKKESDLIIADSISTKEDIVEFLKISEEKIHVVHLGVGSEFYKRSVDEISRVKKKYKISGSYVLSVGTREPRKNLDRTISAFSQIKGKSVQLVIAGNYGWGTETKPIADVQLLGIVDQEDLPALYSGASCFVYPSLYEGFGLPVLEAMKCKTPVVTSNKGSLAEITRGHAIIVEPESIESIAEGMTAALDVSVSKRKEVVAKACVHAQNFTWEKTASNTRTVYNCLV